MQTCKRKSASVCVCVFVRERERNRERERDGEERRVLGQKLYTCTVHKCECKCAVLLYIPDVCSCITVTAANVSAHWMLELLKMSVTPEDMA